MRPGWEARRFSYPRAAFPVLFVLAASAASGAFWDARRSPAAPPPGESVASAFSPEGPAGAPPPEGTDPFTDRWQDMIRDLERAARRHPGRVAIYVKDLRRGREWAYHANDLFPTASLIKVPIMAAVFQKMRSGGLSLHTELTLRRRERMGGSGSVKWQRDGTRLSVHHLLEKMIRESDNTAMRLLIDEVGLPYLQEEFKRMGLVYTEIFPEGLSLQNGRVRYENYTTAREMSGLFERIYRGELVDRFSSEMMLDLLKRRKPRPSRLAKGLPVGWELAHKTGLLRRACHDAGIVFAPDGEYLLTVLTGQNHNYSFAKTFISQVGRITYAHYRDELGLFAKAR